MARQVRRDKDYTEKRVLLDGIDFYSCSFTNCKLVFKGGSSPRFFTCHFKKNIEWVLDGGAVQTVKFLTKMHHAGGESGRKAVEQLVKQILRGRF